MINKFIFLKIFFINNYSFIYNFFLNILFFKKLRFLKNNIKLIYNMFSNKKDLIKTDLKFKKFDLL